MSKINIDYINTKLLEKGDPPLKVSEVSYQPIRTNGRNLLDEHGNPIGTKGDMYAKIIMDKILTEGCYDENPRPVYESDGKPANTLSLNNGAFFQYDLSRGESPMLTLRPIAVKNSISEVLWIYQDASTDLELLKEK